MNFPTSAISLLAGLLVLGGCTKNTPTRTYGGLVSDGRVHNEPVQYNGKRYDATLQLKKTTGAYDVSIRPKRGTMKDTAEDRDIALNVGLTAIRHFGCAQGQKAHLVEGTLRHGSGAWSLTGRCG